ncbi:hypothetical protein IIU_05952 [Bacillus cereus VD133]|uniref:SpoVT-AbrB domain-containing protein n=1 Tax=Bacillus cereus VD133 TaxID=1053233 RepID=A0A9W5PL50_BACCE|nr:AbrB/MazE/SpoVT family DNA-binding domain-containing protein [Bacillus cereus]EOO27153.1 hypothetical protein IIU_05952 [Bacillus cereus VD133]
MKATGIIRKADQLGRMVIPMELRKTLEMGSKVSIEFFVEGENIILKKYQSKNTCMVTGNLSLTRGEIILSLEGARCLLNEMEKYFIK